MIDIDIKGLPMPADAPKPGACIELERPEAGLVILRLVPPHRTLAVFDLPAASAPGCGMLMQTSVATRWEYRAASHHAMFAPMLVPMR